MKRVALVTGAAGGIGFATVAAFVAAGWHVLAADRRAPAVGGEGVEGIEADVSVESGVEELVSRLAPLARLDALVNNAAVQISRPVLELTPEEWDETLRVNLRAAFLTSRACFPALKTAGGSIVNVASVHAQATSKDMSAYAASKGGLVSLTRSLALEFASAGIRVNAVLPGAVETEMLREGFKRSGGDADRARADLIARTPLARIGRPEDIAQAILFLATAELASFITGQCLTVDGGATARLSTE